MLSTIPLFTFCRFNLSEFYKPRKGDYICSMPEETGMKYCTDLPLYDYEGIQCNGTAREFSNNSPSNDSCVNWNQYYTDCRAGDKNPFKGAISFDNIGLAWVAIFQVCIPFGFINDHRLLERSLLKPAWMILLKINLGSVKY